MFIDDIGVPWSFSQCVLFPVLFNCIAVPVSGFSPPWRYTVRLARSRASVIQRHSLSAYFVLLRPVLNPAVVDYGHDHVDLPEEETTWKQLTGAEWRLIREARAGPRLGRPSEGSETLQCPLPPSSSDHAASCRTQNPNNRA